MKYVVETCEERVYVARYSIEAANPLDAFDKVVNQHEGDFLSELFLELNEISHAVVMNPGEQEALLEWAWVDTDGSTDPETVKASYDNTAEAP